MSRRVSLLIALFLAITHRHAVFRSLEDTRTQTARLRLHVDQGFMPIPDEDFMVEPRLENLTEAQDDELDRRVTKLEKRVHDLEVYSKLQTCSIEHLFSIIGSLQYANELVRDIHFDFTYFSSSRSIENPRSQMRLAAASTMVAIISPTA